MEKERDIKVGDKVFCLVTQQWEVVDQLGAVYNTSLFLVGSMPHTDTQ
jgi:hypothetical protein